MSHSASCPCDVINAPLPAWSFDRFNTKIERCSMAVDAENPREPAIYGRQQRVHRFP